MYDFEGAGVGMAMYNTDEVSGWREAAPVVSRRGGGVVSTPLWRAYLVSSVLARMSNWGCQHFLACGRKRVKDTQNKEISIPRSKWHFGHGRECIKGCPE